MAYVMALQQGWGTGVISFKGLTPSLRVFVFLTVHFVTVLSINLSTCLHAAQLADV